MKTRLAAQWFFVVLVGLGSRVSPAAADELAPRVASLIAQLGTRDEGDAIDGLVAIGASAVGPLVVATQAGGRPAGRACEALARIGTPEALETVFGAAAGEDGALRADALAALAHVSSERSFRVLAGALRSDAVGQVRRSAAASLGRLRPDAAVSPLVGALEDEWEWVRVDAAAALGRIGGPQAAAGLVGALRDVRWSVRLQARRGLVAIGPSAVAPLTRAVGDPDPGLRWQAAWALGQIGGDEALRVLERMRGDPDGRVCNELAAAAERKSGVLPPLYPETLAERPSLPSPATAPDGTDLVVMLTREGRWAVVPASAPDAGRRERQRRVDGHDFPTLARTGRHSAAELARVVTVTGRSLAEITDLGRPGALSQSGFLAEDEDVLSVLDGDNRLVAALGLTHPQLARPLFHVWNVVDADATAGRWSMARHRWDRCQRLLYEGREVLVEAHDTKGVQESIFDDGLEGYFSIEIRRPPTPQEEALLRREYGHLPPERWALLVERLSAMQTGEIEPYYVQGYGFYEGHTEWRVDPLAIAFIFGLRTLDEIEAAFPGRLDAELTTHFTR